MHLKLLPLNINSVYYILFEYYTKYYTSKSYSMWPVKNNNYMLIKNIEWQYLLYSIFFSLKNEQQQLVYVVKN